MSSTSSSGGGRSNALAPALQPPVPLLPSQARAMIGDALYLRGRLLQPVRHAHLAVHRRRGGEMLLRLLALARAAVELAEAEVAVGDEGAHGEVTSECQCLAVVDFRVLGAAGQRDVAGEAEGVGLAGSSPQPASEC